MELKDYVRSIPDFPKKGILYRDITPLLENKEAFHEAVDRMADFLRDKNIDLVMAPEARGFVFSAAVAYALNVGMVLARKPGKLPAATVQESYTKEYGTDTIEIHQDAIDETDVVLLHDDLLATGGTMRAAYNLVKKFNPKAIYVNFIIEITDEGLHGRDAFEPGTDITTLITV